MTTMPRRTTRRRKPEQKQELRTKILKAASESFVKQGYEKFSMRSLAQEVGYSVATLYLYFDSKDDLLFTVMDQGFVDFRNNLIQAAAATSDPWERLGFLAQAYVEFALEHPASYQLMFMWRIDYLTETRSGDDRPRIEALRVLHHAVQYAIDKGSVKQGDMQALGDLLWAVVHGISALAIQMPDFDTQRVANLVDHAKRMVYDALST